MKTLSTPLRLLRALSFVLLGAATGSSLATPTRGTQVNNWCAKQPVQATAPQQSRPYQAAGSTCTYCHTSGSPSAGDLNTRAVASSTCSGTGTATTCGTTVNPFCVATAPSNATITAPAAGTTVAQNASLTFSAGNATNPDGFPLAYNWSFSSGQAAVTGQSVAVPMTVAGAVTATLRVRNSVGMLATGTVPTRAVTVTAGSGNQAPTASISAPAANVSIAAGGSVNFQGSGSDPDNNTPLTWSWAFPGGNPASSTAQNPGNVSYAAAGTYTASLTVRDSLGLASTTVSRSITVAAATNQAPSASITAPTTDLTIPAGGSVNFQGSGNDPDNNTPLTWSWSFPGGNPASSTAQNPGNVSYATAGSYAASLTVRDSLGLASTTVIRNVTVAATANQAPSASITAPTADLSIPAGGSVNFQGSGSDPDGNTPLTWSWSFPGGSPATSTAQNPGSISYASAGTYTASLTVRDSLGLASTTVSRSITVTATPGENQAPLASIVVPAASVSIARGGRVYYQGSASDPDNNTPLTYRWTFQGGTPASSTAQNPGSVSYAATGTYTTTLVVSDRLGLASSSVTRSVTVSAVTAPTASITSPTSNVSIVQGRSVSFAGRGSVSGEDRLPLTWRWTFPGGTPATSTLQNPGAVQFNTPGTQVVSLVVTDRRGISSNPVLRTITVTPAPQPPVAAIEAPAANVTINQGQKVSFSGSGSDPDNNLPLTWSWTFSGGTPATSTLQNPGEVTYNRAGSFDATLVVRDRSGLSSSAVRRSITVLPVKPLANIVAPAINVSLMSGGSYSFKGAGSGFALPLRYRWTFEGGSIASSTLQNPGSVRFTTPGPHAVTLTVTDASGNASETATRTITVAAANQIPAAVGQCDISETSDDDGELEAEHDD